MGANSPKWYQKTGFIILFLILFFPVGLYLMWKYTDWNKKLKSGITLVVAVIALLSLMPQKNIESLELTIDGYQDEYDLNTHIPVTITVEPEDAAIRNLEYVSSDSAMGFDFSNDGIDTGYGEKTYELYIKSGDVQSNTVTITVVDMKKRAAEEKAAAEAEAKAQKEAEEKRLAEEQAQREAEEKRLAEEQAEKEAEEKAANETEEQAEPGNSSSSTASSQTASNIGNNFDTYDNSAQQNTGASYVLNTNSKKFHYPGCRSVKKIAPQNYATSDSSRDTLISQGYSPCGNCNP